MRTTILHIGALLAITAFVYSTGLHGQFIFDDQQLILSNPRLINVKTLSDVWTLSDGWRPWLTMSYALNFWWSGLNTFSYHVVNVTLHALNVVLVYWIVLASVKREE